MNKILNDRNISTDLMIALAAAACVYSDVGKDLNIYIDRAERAELEALCFVDLCDAEKVMDNIKSRVSGFKVTLSANYIIIEKEGYYVPA